MRSFRAIVPARPVRARHRGHLFDGGLGQWYVAVVT